MSIASQTLVWAHSQAEGSALLALLCIADHDGDGGAWPSMDTIAQRARVTRETARKLVRKLESFGEITTETNGGGGLRTASHMRTNRYEITIECPPECDRSARHRERSKPVDNCPPPHGGGPSVRRGGPPPHGGANHPLNTPDKQTPTRSEVMGDSEFELKSPNEGQAQAEAEALAKLAAEANHKPVKRPDYSKSTRTSTTPPPRPMPPRFDMSMVPPKPEHVSDEQQAFNLAAEDLRCDAGFGDGRGQYHWCPATGDGCVRCGVTSQQILDQTETTT